jgi:pyroglutamyl-peptidase
VPKLLSTTGENKPDIVLHIGLAARRPFYALERQSPRTPYWVSNDVDGQIFSQEKTEQLWPASDFPQLLNSTFDIEDVYKRWRSNVKNAATDIRTSSDPGNFLCGFIYYLSLSWFWRKQAEERPVMFLHVPHLASGERINEGREVAKGLIRALVESREEVGVKNPLKSSEEVHPMGAAEIGLGREGSYEGWDGIS